MNQDYNNYNQNNNMGYNGIPNTQPFQQQPVYSQRPVYSQQPVPQQPVPPVQPQQPVQPEPVIPVQPVPPQPTVYQPLNAYTPAQNNTKSNKGSLIKLIVFILILVFIGGVAAYIYVSSTSDKLVCKSDMGDITIMYNKDGLTGYKTTGALTYNFDEQKEYAKMIGVDAYISEFNEWFVTNTSGTCKNNGKEMGSNSTNNGGDTTNGSLKEVGAEDYGYVDVPKDWGLYAYSGPYSVQYQYKSSYMVALELRDSNGMTAKDYATNFMNEMQAYGSAVEVTAATVKIGKKNEYTAYQVYVHYTDDGKNRITYWFTAEDEKVHYIALEGYEEIENYMFIPESFRLK